jgi:membrane protease YdiL (CAAX protease family)
VFALAHGLNVVFAAALLLGVVNAVLYERTGSIWPPAAAHATFNLISFALVLAVGGQT